MVDLALITESQIKRIHALVVEIAKEGTSITSIAGSLIGEGIELIMRCGATEDQAREWVGQLIDFCMPMIREALSLNMSTEDEQRHVQLLMDKLGVKRESSS